MGATTHLVTSIRYWFDHVPLIQLPTVQLTYKHLVREVYYLNTANATGAVTGALIIDLQTTLEELHASIQ